MNAPDVLYETSLKSLSLKARGKVRDIYDVDEKHMVIVTTDRLSAFDVVLPDPIPGKGQVLTAVSNFWFSPPGPYYSQSPVRLTLVACYRRYRGMRAATGQGHRGAETQAPAGGGGGSRLPHRLGLEGLSTDRHRLRHRLPSDSGRPKNSRKPSSPPPPRPSWVPTTRISTSPAPWSCWGRTWPGRCATPAIRLYTEAATYALERGIIIADTKFEFGLDEAASCILIDEALTPDSSRFWPADQYRVGISPAQLRQAVRARLSGDPGLEQDPPGPRLPQASSPGPPRSTAKRKPG